MISPRLGLPMLGVFAAATIMLGCGIEGQPFGSETETDSDPVVSSEEISSAEADSPERAVLEWWRFLQNRDARSVEAAYTDDISKDLPDGFRYSVASLIAPVAAQSGIVINSVEPDGDEKTATVFATIDSPLSLTDGPLAVPVEKADGEWLLTDETFLLSLAGQLGVATGNEKTPPSDGG